VLGPLPPGETVLEVHYRLPASGGPASAEGARSEPKASGVPLAGGTPAGLADRRAKTGAEGARSEPKASEAPRVGGKPDGPPDRPAPFVFARRFAAAVPLLSVYVADPGNLRAASERLHRRRPARTPDRTYLHLEAFELAPGEEVAVALSSLPLRRDLPRAATVGLVALATGLAALALAGPLRGAVHERAAASGESESPAEREREALRAALGDLEHDFETGKLEQDDYARMRDELESRTASLQALPSPAPALGASAPAPCPACGHTPAADDRFCARCGAKLAGGTPGAPQAPRTNPDSGTL
jgi:hypothetical protein